MIKKIYTKYFLIFFVFIFGFCSSGRSQNLSDSLVGVWQDSKIAASGWSNTFLFYKNGKFKFFYNQMDCAKREVSFSGKWKVVDDELKLTVTHKKIVKGGTLELSTGSCASDSMIVDGVEKTVKLKPYEKLIYSVSGVYTDNEDGIRRLKIYIDAMSYWKFADDPEELINQFE